VSRLVREYVAAPLRQIASLRETAHRPWPRPSFPLGDGPELARSPVLALACAARRPATSRAPRLHLDVHGGSAWLGITPFELVGFRPVALPPVPKLSTFPELNVRTYVTYGGKPGIWFFSLDADSRLAVAAARRFYRLPYFHARMAAEWAGAGFAFRSERSDSQRAQAVFSVRHEPRGEAWRPPPGSLEAFLVERYCLTRSGNRDCCLRANIHHPPWRIRRAAFELSKNTMAPAGVELSDTEALAHYSARQDVLIWPPKTAAD
jgi:uncharacterized protein